MGVSEKQRDLPNGLMGCLSHRNVLLTGERYESRRKDGDLPHGLWMEAGLKGESHQKGSRVTAESGRLGEGLRRSLIRLLLG